MGFPELVAVADRAARDLLGGAISYARQFEDPHDLVGIFDAVGFREVIGDESFVATGPQLFCLLEDLRAALGQPDYDPEADDPTITVSGINYRAKEIRPDGMGGVTFFLSERGS